MTLVELLVVVAILAVLLMMIGPPQRSVRIRAMQTRNLSNGKQIALALSLYAGDNDGKFPSYELKDGKPGAAPVTNSNTAYAQLFPIYVQNEEIFWDGHSKFCNPSHPDNVYDNPLPDTPVETLKHGENCWAYVRGLNNKSPGKVPLVAEGFFSATSHTYSRSTDERGGVWEGKKAVVIRVDMSGAVEPVDQKTLQVAGKNNATGAIMSDIFTTADAAKGWLHPENVTVNPK